VRAGRFSKVAELQQEPVRPLSFPQLLIVDIAATHSLYDARIAQDRVRMLAHSAAFLLIAHLVGATLILLSAVGSDGISTATAMTALPMFVLLGLDVAFWLVTRRQRKRQMDPKLVVRLATAYCALTGLSMMLMIKPAIDAANGNPIVYAALAATFFLSIPAFLGIPALVLETYLLALLALSLLGTPPELMGAATALGGCLLWFSLVSARDYILMVGRRLSTEWQAEKARRFVAEFEQSGQGWFWETNAEGDLLYVSEQLAEDLKRQSAELVGTRFTDLLSVEDARSPEALERTLGFHLSARFPFSEVTVRANTEEEVWWTVSGSPNFDEFGKFLGFRGIGTDLTEKRKSDAEISRLARYDSLTSLPNRSLMRQTLEEALRNAERRRKGCSLFLIDLDRFKNVNDTMGHPIGDLLLRQVAERLTSVIGDRGQVGRLGGDEFKAVFPGVDEHRPLAELAERLIRQVSMPYMIEGHNISIGASIGIAIAPPTGSCSDALVRNADLALYAAKADGRGTWKFFAPEMHSEARDRQILEQELRGAVARGELAVYFQPTVNAITEEVVGFEALARWTHPTRGFIPPSTFIPLAEECGLILSIGEWVLRTACAEAAKWPTHIKVAVNISPIQFAHASLPGLIVSALKSADLDPERLELEITEGVFLADSESTDDMFAKLKTIGVQLALDDFGTGYSSLGYLRKAPFDKIKIDQSFVRGAATPGNRNAAIIRSIVTLAESLNMETTAEGAETHDELNLIRQLGCSQVQGYIFGKPAPADETFKIASQATKAIADGHQFSRAPRHRIIRKAALEWDDRTLDVRLRDISPGGALLECNRGLAPGTAVLLTLPGCTPLEGEVRWSDDGRMGVRFKVEFDLRQLAPNKGANVNTSMLKPEYLSTEQSPASPWAARQERLTPDELRKAG
jgi:diguanylate cyclase (GGDEF)-like protein